MRVFKLSVLLISAVFATFSCARSGNERFVISESKSYPASLFRQNCAICHGPEADGRTLDNGTVVPGLRDGPYKYHSGREIYEHIANGGNGMTPFRNQLTERELNLMVDFVQKDLRQGKEK